MRHCNFVRNSATPHALAAHAVPSFLKLHIHGEAYALLHARADTSAVRFLVPRSTMAHTIYGRKRILLQRQQMITISSINFSHQRWGQLPGHINEES